MAQLAALAKEFAPKIVLEMLCSNPKRDMSFDKESHIGQLDRITQQTDVMGGKACSRGMRVTVGMVVGQVVAGHSVQEILTDYPYLEREVMLINA